MTKEEYKMMLWKEYVQQAPFIEEVRKEGCIRLGEAFVKGNVSFSYEIYHALMEQERFRLDERLELEYEKDGEDYFLRYQGEEWLFEREELKDFLEYLISIFEEVLPLGSVVDLKKEFLEETIPLKDVERVRVVIVQRYVGESPEGFYYPYAGTLYPTGIPGSRRLIEFTPSLIENVVRHGYSDEQEDAYVYLMKRELMLERKLHSMGFADKKEREVYMEYLKGVNAL